MIDILAPAEQEGTKAVVRAWLKNVGDTVAENEPLVELETDKVTQEVPAPASGILAEILLGGDAEVGADAILGRLRVAAEATVEPTESPAARVTAAPPPAEPAPVLTDPELRLSPSVRRALAESRMDPAGICGTGRDGRLTRADVDAAVEARAKASAPTEITPSPAVETKSATGSRDVPHDRMRLAIAENMLRSVATAPHVTAVFEVDFTAIAAHRKRHKDRFAADGAHLTFTAYFVAAAAAAMHVAPAINARWHPDRLEMFADVNIGVGTALGEKGLVVPVVQKAQNLSLAGIARRLTEMTAAARANRLTPADMRGGTFTISNHGVSGSLIATPVIIAQPQSAILGIGKLEKRVVVREIDGQDTIQIRPMAYVTLTIDHRVVDGHQTNAWLTRFVEILERWPQDGA